MTLAQNTIVKCYEILTLTTFSGIEDYTDGIYNNNPLTDYNKAQKNQHEYLLKELGVWKGFKLLDVGCGLGTLLQTAKEKGVDCTGITISPDQVKICKKKGLNVFLYNYKSLSKSWFGKFDGIIANGSLEHFCQPEEAINGKQDEVYKNMFEIFAKLLNPKSKCKKVATTAIHFSKNHIDPKKFIKNPILQIFDNQAFHFSILHRGYGGYYPIKDQLKYSAKGKFKLIKEVDGTQDYYFTSEYWAKKAKYSLYHNAKFRKALFKEFIKNPIHTIWFSASLIGPEAWPWQFRGKYPPTKLYRHTWKLIE